jgi:hypothetical protein
MVQFMVNSAKSGTSGFSPFELACVRIPESIPRWASAPSSAKADEFIERALLHLACARDLILKYRTLQAIAANKHRRAAEIPGGSTSATMNLRTGEHSCIVTKGNNFKYWVSSTNFHMVPFRSWK